MTHGITDVRTAEDLEALIGGPGRTGVVFDFDGVLAPIVDDPEASRLPDDLRGPLRSLVAGVAHTAVLSGRPLGFLRERVGDIVPGLLGSYGVQRLIDGVETIDERLVPWLPAVVAAVHALREGTAGLAGVHVEDKLYSVAVHWRRAQAPDAAGACAALCAQVAADLGLVVEPGKMVLELRPPVATGKGEAITQLIAAVEVDRWVYFGDDLGDLPAFRAVLAAGGVAALVGQGGETPAELAAVRTVEFDGTGEFHPWLAHVGARLTR